MDISSVTALGILDLLKALGVLSDTTIRIFAIEREDLKPFWKSEKGHIIEMINKHIV